MRRGHPRRRHAGRGNGAGRAGGRPRDARRAPGHGRAVRLHERRLGVRKRAAREAARRGLTDRSRRDLRVAARAGVGGHRDGRGRRADGDHPPGHGLRPRRRAAQPVRGDGRWGHPAVRGRRGEPLDARPRRRPGRPVRACDRARARRHARERGHRPAASRARPGRGSGRRRRVRGAARALARGGGRRRAGPGRRRRGDPRPPHLGRAGAGAPRMGASAALTPRRAARVRRRTGSGISSQVMPETPSQ